MSEITAYFLAQVELFIAAVLLLAVLKIGRVGMSFLIAIGVFVCRDIFDQFAMVQMLAMDGPRAEKIALWYSMFALSTVFSMLAIYLLHKIVKTPLSGVARAIMWLSYATLVLMVVRCFERMFIGTNVLADIYAVGIPTLSYLHVAVFTVGIIKVYQRSKEFGERIEWSM